MFSNRLVLYLLFGSLWWFSCRNNNGIPETEPKQEMKTKPIKTVANAPTVVPTQVANTIAPVAYTPTPTPPKPSPAWWQEMSYQWQQLLDKKLTDEVTQEQMDQMFNAVSQIIAPNQNLSTIRPLASLSNISQLSIGGNNLRDISDVGHLKKITHLQVPNTQINQIGAIQELALLHQLDVSNNQVTDLSPLVGLNKLRDLNASDNPIEDIRPLQQCSLLSTINLSRTQVRDLSPLASSNSIRKLILQETPVSDLKPIKAINGITHLNISRTKVKSLAAISNYTSLKMLNIRFTPISQGEIAAFKEKYPDCMVME